jgi:peptidoglycan/xylan/chitin deacetylase (PgdA/CDA1 family)
MEGYCGIHKVTGESMESAFRVKNWYWHVIILILALTIPLLPSETYSQLPHFHNLDPSEIQGQNSNSAKMVILNFDDSHDSQIKYAKPILEKYGFKATFFEVCGRISGNDWLEITELRNDGMDIEAHTMTHPNLNELSVNMLDWEIHQSKNCFLQNGINTSIFAYPYGNGWNNKTVLHTISKYYDLARTDSKNPLTFLNCDRWNNISYSIGANDSSNSMPSCVRNENFTQRSTGNYSSNLQQTLGSSRYAINSWSHKHIDGTYDYRNLTCIDDCQYYNNSQMFDRFVKAINSQDYYNKDGLVKAIPIIVYHAFVPYDDVIESKIPTDTSVKLFDSEMKYLYENGFKVLTMADLGYDVNRGTLYITNSTTNKS